jgi:hypothetical protein
MALLYRALSAGENGGPVKKLQSPHTTGLAHRPTAEGQLMLRRMITWRSLYVLNNLQLPTGLPIS